VLRKSDLLRIVILRQLRQVRVGVTASITIGIAMFIMLHVVGNNIEDRVTQDVSLIGNVTILSAEHEEYRYPNAPLQFFVKKTVELLRTLPEVHNASMCMRSPHTVLMQTGESQVYIYLLGVDAAYWDVYDLYALEGRLLTAEDEEKRSKVCVLGEKIARQIFGDGPWTGRRLTLFNDNYTVVGIVGGFMLQGRNDRCYVPLSTVADRSLEENNYPNRILVRMKHLNDVEAMYEKLPGLIRSQQKAPYLRLEYPSEGIRNVRLVVGRVHLLLQLAIIAALGLGCFGIWQSSFASVRERTREIGLKLAMGAEQRDIMLQFLGEALCSALLGGVAGVVTGLAVVISLSLAVGFPLAWGRILFSVPVSLCVAALVGAAGGSYPAVRAGRMDVAAALRFE
jgi:putative ABC transport system permease protein